jgi:threonine/homoserine/homoserine lactone efflux protein
MLGTQHLGVFVIAGLLLNITPGPDTLYLLGRTLSQGRAAGIVSVLGISTGCLVHTCAAALGLSLVLSESILAFTVIKLAGAIYLIWLGISTIRPKAGSESVPPHQYSAQDNFKIYRQAVITNVLNPKVALFFLAFLPQFILATGGTRPIAFLFLGAIFVFNGMIYCFLLVFFACAIMNRLQGDPTGSAWMRRITGTVFIGLGLRLALEKRP